MIEEMVEESLDSALDNEELNDATDEQVKVILEEIA